MKYELSIDECGASIVEIVDVVDLRERITQRLGIEISFAEAYLFWLAVSNECSAQWLDVNTWFEFDEDLLEKLKEYGEVKEVERKPFWIENKGSEATVSMVFDFTEDEYNLLKRVFYFLNEHSTEKWRPKIFIERLYA